MRPLQIKSKAFIGTWDEERSKAAGVVEHIAAFPGDNYQEARERRSRVLDEARSMVLVQSGVDHLGKGGVDVTKAECQRRCTGGNGNLGGQQEPRAEISSGLENDVGELVENTLEVSEHSRSPAGPMGVKTDPSQMRWKNCRKRLNAGRPAVLNRASRKVQRCSTAVEGPVLEVG